MTSKKKLPEKLSATIKLALKDLKAVEKSKDYIVDMDVWHNPYNGKCAVCFAGSVMAKTLKVAKEEGHDPREFGYNVERKLLALDHVRTGDVEYAIQTFYNVIEFSAGGLLEGIKDDFPVPRYSNSTRRKFHAQMLKIANNLERIGL